MATPAKIHCKRTDFTRTTSHSCPTFDNGLISFKDPDILVQWQGPPGTSYPEMVHITALASHELRGLPGVRGVSALIGRSVLGDQLVDVNSAELVVRVDPNANYDGTMASIQKVVQGYPGLFRVVQTYLNDKTKQALAGSSDDVVVRIFGHDLDILRSKADEVKHALSGIDGTSAIHKERLAPILMTALAAGLALIPLAISGDIPGQEIEYPMAIVILGGLVTSTVLNLFIVPSLYLRFGKKREKVVAAVVSVDVSEVEVAD